MSLLVLLVVAFVGTGLALLARPWPRIASAIGLTGLAVVPHRRARARPDRPARRRRDGARVVAVPAPVPHPRGVHRAAALAHRGRRRHAPRRPGRDARHARCGGPRPVDPRSARRGPRDHRRRHARRPADDRARSAPGSAPGVGLRDLRAVVVAGAMAIAATAWIGRDLQDLVAQPVVFGLAYLAFALAVAIRFGVIPFHIVVARLTDAVPETGLPILIAARARRRWPSSGSPGSTRRSRHSRSTSAPSGPSSSPSRPPRSSWPRSRPGSRTTWSTSSATRSSATPGVVMLAFAALDPAAWTPGPDLDPRLRRDPERLRRPGPRSSATRSGRAGCPTCAAGRFRSPLLVGRPRDDHRRLGRAAGVRRVRGSLRAGGPRPRRSAPGRSS